MALTDWLSLAFAVVVLAGADPCSVRLVDAPAPTGSGTAAGAWSGRLTRVGTVDDPQG